MNLCKSRSKPIEATVHIISSPMDAPAGLLTRCLFGTSIQSLAAEISTNRNGEWDDVYAEA